ncbi:MAG: AAA family ATPase, partial [Deltaproteobacteria bacterium]|nr:AAA family ATPase [Deltaproteobacteria bacterium]
MIKRHLFKPLQSHLSRKEITLITGPRQAGKTTLMKLLENQLRQEGKKTLFLNLDIQSHLPFFASQETLLQKIELEIGRSKGFVFIDEIQRVPNAGIFLKGLYDLDLPYKFIVSGSGSLELKEQIHESLAGRKRIFELTTLTFQEFVNYKTNYRYENILPRFFQIEEPKAKKLLDEYLQFGG